MDCQASPAFCNLPGWCKWASACAAAMEARPGSGVFVVWRAPPSTILWHPKLRGKVVLLRGTPNIMGQCSMCVCFFEFESYNSLSDTVKCRTPRCCNGVSSIASRWKKLESATTSGCCPRFSSARPILCVYSTPFVSPSRVNSAVNKASQAGWLLKLK